jgi:DNA-binding transcriptional regulator LsrR (DeoR family)
MKNHKNEKEMRKLSFLAEIASLYYEKDLTQSEIADRMYISRSRVSRLLKESKERGLVTVKINFTGERFYELEEILKQKFNLKDARVFNSRYKNDNDIMTGIGNLAAKFLEENIKEGDTLGISYGKAVYNTIHSFKAVQNISKVKVVQIMGSSSLSNVYIDSRELISTTSKLFNGKAHYLNAPLYMEDDYARNVIKTDYVNLETLNLASKADILLTGIGSLDLETFSHLWKGYLDEDYIDTLKEYGVAGYICAYCFDINGDVLDIDINKRIIGIDITDLRKINTVIGVAGGYGKARALLGALNGKFINVLVTDYNTANEIITIGK